MRCLILIILLLSKFAHAKESICYGTTSKGRLDNGIALPSNCEVTLMKLHII